MAARRITLYLLRHEHPHPAAGRRDGARVSRERRQLRWHVLHRRAHHGHLLPPVCRARKPLPGTSSTSPRPRGALRRLPPLPPVRPLTPPGTVPEWVTALLVLVERTRPWLARRGPPRAGVEPARARRYFQRALRHDLPRLLPRPPAVGRARQLRSGEPLDDAACARGWDSHSGFRDAFTRRSARARRRPPRARRARRDAGVVETPLGPMVAGATDAGLCLLEFSDRRMLEAPVRDRPSPLKQPPVPGEHPHLARTARRAGATTSPARCATSPCRWYSRGRRSSERVWRELCAIPYGETLSYQELAAAVGDAEGSARSGAPTA